MAINRAQLVKELEPGLNALFGLEYDRYENEHSEIFDTESSDRAFEEEVMLSGFAQAPTKGEGAAVSYDTAQETFTSRYTHETIALAFALTEVEKGFRRISGYADLPKLIAALEKQKVQRQKNSLRDLSGTINRNGDR